MAISGSVYLVFKSWAAFFTSMLGGLVLDIDHILDYYLQQGFTLKIKKIYLWCIEKKFDFVFMFCHSMELLFLLWIIISVYKLGLPWIVFALGLTHHMVLDILFNQDIFHIYSYLLLYRFVRGFKKEYIAKNNLILPS